MSIFDAAALAITVINGREQRDPKQLAEELTRAWVASYISPCR
jgi:hypothetical protein